MQIKDIEDIMIYKVLAGSRAYGLELPTSDYDYRGIFLQDNSLLLTGNNIPQVGDKKSDQVYYEFNRFMDLLCGANPNILENLFVPTRCIEIMQPAMGPLYNNREKFLTKKIKWTFGGYAISQIKKARGQNKKIVNPMDKERKTPLDFCYAIRPNDGYMHPIIGFLKELRLKQESIGLSEMPNGPQLFKAYIQRKGDVFRGIMSEDGADIRHSEIPRGRTPFCFLWYNKDGYSTYCKEYKEYWNWVEKRNPVRYADNAAHGQGYDGKNLMHCIRMLDMAIEVAKGEGMNLERPNREYLLSVRRGEASYDEIMAEIEEKKILMDEAFDNSKLPEKLDRKFVSEIILKTRKA